MKQIPILTIKGNSRKLLYEASGPVSQVEQFRGSRSKSRSLARELLNQRITVRNPNRKITVSASMYVEDDEWFGSNETVFRQQTNSAILSAEGIAQTVMVFEVRMGGEIRVEFTVTGSLVDNYGNVVVNGVVKLYEGISESTGDLDGVREFNLYVPVGTIVNNYVRIDNDDEGGDFATIKMNITNTPA